MDFFDIIAPIYEKLHLGSQKTFNKIESLIDFKPSDKVLDLGGGTGRIAKFFQNKVQNITVADSSRKMIEQCQNLHPKLSCVSAKAENLPFGDGGMDKIIIVDAFHHFKDQEQAIREIERVLAKDGQIAVEEFNPLTITGKLAALAERLLGMGSIFHTPESLAELFSKHGFKAKLIDEDKTVYYLIGEKR